MRPRHEASEILRCRYAGQCRSAASMRPRHEASEIAEDLLLLDALVKLQ